VTVAESSSPARHRLPDRHTVSRPGIAPSRKVRHTRITRFDASRLSRQIAGGEEFDVARTCPPKEARPHGPLHFHYGRAGLQGLAATPGVQVTPENGEPSASFFELGVAIASIQRIPPSSSKMMPMPRLLGRHCTPASRQAWQARRHA